MSEDEPQPTDAYIQSRVKQVEQTHPASLHEDKLYKFMQFDRKVLRFYCVWDDRVNMYGEVREFVCAFGSRLEYLIIYRLFITSWSMIPSKSVKC